MLRGLKAELSRFLDSQDPGRDVGLLAFVLVVVAAIGWLTTEVALHRALTSAFTTTFQALAAFVGVGAPLRVVSDRLGSSTTPTSSTTPPEVIQ